MTDFGNKEMEGIIVPMITPFKKNGEIDETALRELVSFLKSRVHGLFVNGSLGSGPLMNVEERKKTLEIIMEEARDDIQVCCHIGAISTQDVIELGKHAEKMRAVAVASLIPYFYSHNESVIENFFITLMKEIKTPIYVYNNPARTMINISTDLLKRLADIGIKGIKESSFNILNYYEYIQELKGRDFYFLVGTEALLLSTTLMRCEGCISAIANCFPEEIIELWDEAVKNNIKKAAELQEKVLNIRRALKGASTKSNCKISAPIIQRVLRGKGINAGYPRAPFMDVTEEFFKEVRNNLRNIGMNI